MMLGLADENTAFILDKVEGNKKLTNTGKPTWSSLVNLTDFSMKGLDAATNPFCAAGMTLGNGTYIVVGGNKAVSYGGGTPQGGDTGPYAPYHDQDGRRVVRIMEPADNSGDLQWIDQYNSPNQMDSERWYPGIEGLADGSVVIIGGATSGGYINRNYPNVDPVYETTTPNPPDGNWAQGGANPSYEFWPPTNKPQPAKSQFMIKTSGLNMYPHTYLMPSGKIFMQANYSTTLWDPYGNTEEDLPDMPGQIVRVYPASAATAMLPLTPANNYTPTILFCGGSTASDEQWGNYTAPNINMYQHSANTECHSITPEKSDGSAADNVDYVHEEDLPEGRSMGQFIILPNGKLWFGNGIATGTAGYTNNPNQAGQPVGNSFGDNPVLNHYLYDPSKPAGQRWSHVGRARVGRLYHSSATLLPDSSILISGSNPNMDYTDNEKWNTEYRVERWYPDFYNQDRPSAKGLPNQFHYGGKGFTINLNNANEANNAKVVLIRTGFSTHAMNMGQRMIELRSKAEGSQLHVAQMPNNPNLFAPGPALAFVVVNGVPSHGKFVTVGNGQIGNQPTHDNTSL